MNATPAASATEPQGSPFSRGITAALESSTPKPVVVTEGPFARYRDDPVGFAREVLGLTVWARMEEILLAARDHLRVAVRSGHKVSKSTTAAVIGLWRVYCRPGSRTVITAPTVRQVKMIIWGEMTRLNRAARLPGTIPIDPGTGMKYMDAEVYGFTTDEPEKMAGVSGADLKYIIDEASGVAEAIYQAIEGNMAGGGSLLLISNPTQTSGTFYDAFTTKRHLWKTIHISSTETPNVISGELIIPGLAVRAWCEEKLNEYGADSPLYQVRVLGNFPSQGENTVIGLSLVEAARKRYDAQEGPPTGAFAIGVDVARFGDDSTVLQPVFGHRTLPPRVHGKQDNVEVAGHVLDLVEELRAAHDYPVTAGLVKVKVDDLGNGGGVTDHLRHSDRAKALGIDLMPVSVSEAATSEGYSKLRDQLWFAMRDWLKEGGELPPVSKLEGELVAAKYSFDTQGRSKVEKKDEMKKRLQRSPDHADALGLALYRPRQAKPAGVSIPGAPWQAANRAGTLRIPGRG
ncbi:hypothetical protein [Deinococcus yunweiensis]|uniref:hypothetical protein n=1 Tax=Deinococcus yunweiensis TaxID=367282 RepID=UPI00398F0095